MANNPYTNKVEYAGQTLIDLTGDTATAADVAKGKIFHLASGAQAIGTLEGGGGASKNDVNFYDYDGTIVKSYSAAEFANLTALPDNPSHTGLTAQGWNWTLADAKTYVASYGKLEIGQMYITDDGKTRIYIRLEDGRLAPYLGIAINGTATVEWGDGQTSIVTGSSTSTVVSTQHAYASAGDYVIKIAVSGSMELRSSSAYSSQVLWGNFTSGNYNRVYQNGIQKVEIGANTSIGSYAFQNCFSLASVMISSGATIIAANAFQSCLSLASVTVPDGVTGINGSSFNGCVSLSSIAIPSSVTSIAAYTFNGCTALTSITIPSGVTSINTNTFNGCTSLVSVPIPSGVTNIGNSVFQSCYALKSITIPSSVTSIGNNIVQSCRTLASATILGSVTSIVDNMFNGCLALAEITIPDSVTNIAGSAFYGCYNLASITIPSSVTSIGLQAFQNCYGLGYIKFEPTTPPTVSSSNAWTGIPTDCIIYVPRGSLSAYTSATNYPSSSDYTYVEY